MLGHPVFHLLESLKVVNLLLILLDAFHVLQHLVLEVVLISIIVIVTLVFISNSRLFFGLFLCLPAPLSVGTLDLHLDLLELLQVLHLVLVEAHHIIQARLALDKVLECLAFIVFFRDSLLSLGGRLVLFAYLHRFTGAFSASGALDRYFLGGETLLTHREL